MAAKETRYEENLKMYNMVAEVPKEAQKMIKGGRLSGFTDINPMWRIKKMTELFGPCGTGWKYTTEQWAEESPMTKEVTTNVKLKLYYRTENGEWSEPIEAFGGSKSIAVEKNGAFTNDEAYKMAFTDALGTAMKMLGFGGTIYWNNDPTKYSEREQAPRTQNARANAPAQNQRKAPDKSAKVSPFQVDELVQWCDETRSSVSNMCAFFKVKQVEDMTMEQYEVAKRKFRK